MIKRFLLSAVLIVLPLWAHADWAADRDASAGYVTVTTLATAVDEPVPFVKVDMSDLGTDFWTAMDTASDTDGKTIRVSTSDGVTQLACVPIGVNTSTDTGCLIFLATGMSASVDVDYRIYVGNAALSMPTASGGMGEQAVFASYAGVYFPGVDTRDWTAGGRTLTAVNSPGTAASGYEGITAATYNGTSQYHYYSGTQGVTDWPLTLETIVSADNTTQTGMIACLSDSTTTNNQHYLFFNASDDKINAASRGSSGISGPFDTSTYSATTNYFVVATRDQDNGITILYKNGTSPASDADSLGAMAGWNRFAIGYRLDSTPDSYLDGNVAVALLSSSVRSADYVSTMQDNWAGTMYSTGAWTAASSCGSGSTGMVLFGSNSQTATADANWNDLAASLVDDATTTDVTLDDVTNINSETITYAGADLSGVPTDATSYTVTFRIKRRGDTSTAREINDLVVKFRDGGGTLRGDNLADLAGVWPTIAASKDYVLTGYTPTGSDWTSSTGLDLQATAFDSNGNTLAEVYTVWIQVDWEGAPCDEGSNWFSMWND